MIYIRNIYSHNILITPYPYCQEAITYFNRVEADGGVIASKVMSNASIARAVQDGWYSTTRLWFSGAGGYKETNGKVTKWYNMSSGSNDATQSNTSFAPTLVPPSLGTFGNPALRFDADGAQSGTTLLLGNLSSLFQSGSTLFIIGDQGVEDEHGSLYATKTGNDQWWYLSGLSSYPGAFLSTRLNGVFSDAPQIGINIWEISASPSRYIMNINKNRVYSGSGANYEAGDAHSISDSNGPIYRAFSGKIPELIAFGSDIGGQPTGALSSWTPVSYTGTRELVSTYLRNKYIAADNTADKIVDNYIARVTADGGSVADSASLLSAVSSSITHGWFSNSVLWFSGVGGYKTSSATKVSKWYNICNNVDAYQTNVSLQPNFNAIGSASINSKPTISYPAGTKLEIGCVSSLMTRHNSASLFVVSEQMTNAQGNYTLVQIEDPGVDSWWGLGADSYQGSLRGARVNASYTSPNTSGSLLWQITSTTSSYYVYINGTGSYVNSSSGNFHVGYAGANRTHQINYRGWSNGTIPEVILAIGDVPGHTSSLNNPVIYSGQRQGLVNYLTASYKVR